MSVKQSAALIVAPAVVALACLLIDHLLPFVHFKLLYLLATVFGPPDESVRNVFLVPQHRTLDFFLCALLSTSAIFATYELTGSRRSIALALIVAVSLLIQWVLWYWAGYEVHVLVFTLPIPLGFAAGYGLTALRVYKEKPPAVTGTTGGST
jgi:hypothetical protein